MRAPFIAIELPLIGQAEDIACIDLPRPATCIGFGFVVIIDLPAADFAATLRRLLKAEKRRHTASFHCFTTSSVIHARWARGASNRYITLYASGPPHSYCFLRWRFHIYLHGRTRVTLSDISLFRLHIYFAGRPFSSIYRKKCAFSRPCHFASVSCALPASPLNDAAPSAILHRHRALGQRFSRYYRRVCRRALTPPSTISALRFGVRGRHYHRHFRALSMTPERMIIR